MVHEATISTDAYDVIVRGEGACRSGAEHDDVVRIGTDGCLMHHGSGDSRQPVAAHSNGDYRGKTQQRALRSRAAHSRAPCKPPDEHGERAHRGYARYSEEKQVRARREIGRQRECREDAEEMSAAGSTVQGAHGECLVAVGVSYMCARPACASQRRADAPESDADENESDQALAPGGYCLDRERIAQYQNYQPDDEHTRGVA